MNGVLPPAPVRAGKSPGVIFKLLGADKWFFNQFLPFLRNGPRAWLEMVRSKFAVLNLVLQQSKVAGKTAVSAGACGGGVKLLASVVRSEGRLQAPQEFLMFLHTTIIIFIYNLFMIYIYIYILYRYRIMIIYNII